MKKTYISLLFLLSGCYLSVNPLESLSPPLEVSPSPSAEAYTAPEEIKPTVINLAAIDKAQEFYLWAAQEGYPQGQKIYGQWLLTQGKTEEGMEWLAKAAAQGCDAAEILMAEQIGLSNPDQAITALTPLLAKGYVPALVLAADLRWQQGQKESSLLYLEKAAQMGDLPSQALLAKKVAQKDSLLWSEVEHMTSGFDKDLFPQSQSHDFSDHSAEKSIKPASTLQEMADLNNWISPEQFIELFVNAADMGSPYAAFQQLDLRLRYPTLMPKLKTSFSELAKLASAIPPGAVLEARLILKNQIPGTYERAWSNLEQAAAEKEPYALFACSMRARYLRQFPEALKLYQEGLSQPNYSSALIHASQDLIDGYLGFFDDEAGFDGLFYLAQSSNPYALMVLADYNLSGKIAGTPEEAFMMRYRAAWSDIPMAQYLLGNMYLTGQGIAQSDSKAFRWFNQSARQGYRPAQYQLSKMYEKGQGVIPCLVEAYAWRSISMRGLHEDPQYHVSTIASQLSWDQLACAVDLTEHYKQSHTHSGFA